MPKQLKPPKSGKHMLAPMAITKRAARFLASASKREGKPSSTLVREAIDLMEQMRAGNARLVVSDRGAYDKLSTLQVFKDERK